MSFDRWYRINGLAFAMVISLGIATVVAMLSTERWLVEPLIGLVLVAAAVQVISTEMMGRRR